MRRRAFIAALGSALVGRQRAARNEPIASNGSASSSKYGEPDAGAQSRLNALSQGLRALGWTNGSNLHIEHPLPPASRTDASALRARTLGR